MTAPSRQFAMPSREFFIQQAVLNAFSDTFPMARMCDTLPSIMRFFVQDHHVPQWLRNRINIEFARISSQYEVRAA